MMKLQNPYFKGAMPTTLDFILDFNKHHRENFTEVLKEYLFVQSYCIYFRKNSYLVHRVNQIIGVLQTNGIISRWERQSIDHKYINRPPVSKRPKTLNLDQVMGGICIYFIGLGIGFLVFVLEIVSLKIASFRNIYEWIIKVK